MDSDRPAQLVGSSGAALPSFETIMTRYVSESSVQNEEAHLVYNQWKEDDPDSLFMELVGVLREYHAMFICFYNLNLWKTHPLDWVIPFKIDKWKHIYPPSKFLQPVREVSEDDVIRARLNCNVIAHMLPSELLSKWGVMAPKTRSLVVSILLECIEMEVPSWVLFMSLSKTLIQIKLHPVSSFDDLNIVNRVESVLLKTAATITNLLNEGDVLSCNLGLNLLVSFFDAWLAGMNHGQFLGFMLPVVMNESFAMEIRHLAIEYLLCLAEAQHDLPQNIWEELLQVLMHKLLDINDDGVPGEFFHIGEVGLGRLASALDGHMIFNYMHDLVVEYLDDAQDWKKRFSGLKCIAQMADGCSEVLVDDRLDSIFALVLNAFVDPNACVQRAAFDSVGYLASALDGEMIFNYMYGLVVEYLDDAHDWRNRFSGLKCIAQMADGCSEVLVDDRLDSIFYLVLNAFVDDNACVQRAAFDSVRYLAKYLSPNFQNRNAGRVLKGLLGVIMASHRDPELKADAVQAMRDFFKTCNEDIKKRYRNDMADKLSYFHVTL